MICPNCKKEIKDGVPFCGYCGYAIVKEHEAAMNSQAKQTPQYTPPVQQAPKYTPPVQQTPKYTPPVQQAPKYTPPVQQAPKYTSPVQQAPKYTSPVQQAPQYTPPVKKPKKPNPMFAKDNLTKVAFVVVMAVIYIGIAVIFALLPNIEESIKAVTVSDAGAITTLTLSEYFNILINGNRIFNPTAISTALGIGGYIFVYAVPVFALIALFAVTTNKKAVAFNTTSAIFSFIGIALCIGIAPLSLLLIKDFKSAVALSLGVLSDDLARISYIPILILTITAFVLVIASFIILAQLNKRRAE